MESTDNNNYTTPNNTVVEFSPGMTKYYIPQCEHSIKPYEGQKFKLLDDGIDFYKNYALACGFDIRRGSQVKARDGCITWKYMYCNREGDKNSSDFGSAHSSKKRRTVSNRVCCMARVVFKFIGSDGYVITLFIERHTHTLVSDAFKYLMKMNRKLDPAHQKFVLNCAKANVGPMTTYKLLKETVGGYNKIGATSVDLKNFSRDLKAYVLGVDAQMVIDKLLRKRELCPAFVFDYEVDNTEQLTRLFWADPTSRRNFSAFGDVISFDATYETNRYKMIFAPFTGKDNHGRCVTFGAALFSGEDIDTYFWVFDRFKKCMGVGPKIIMTDQDPAIKKAVERALPDTKHRLCMWHIMKKVSEKVPPALKKDLSFINKFNSMVWSVLDEPLTFEEKWQQTMTEFGLIDDKWFKSIYDIRDTWIPAYFRDFPMGGLFRTTSLSECENSFFGRFMSNTSNLLEFFMFFDSALDSQRHSHAQLNNEAMSCYPDCRTPLLFEKHASKVYTRHIFLKVQDDIYSACYECRLKGITEDEYTCLYEIDDCLDGVSNVVHTKLDNTFVCSCKKFLRLRLLCCHIFFIFKDSKLTAIPDKYITSRWTKFPSFNHMEGGEEYVDSSTIDVEENKILINDLVSEFYSCVDFIEGDPDKTRELLHVLRYFKDQVKPSEEQTTSTSVKRRLFDQFYGSSIPEEVYVNPPLPVKTKGSGSRIKSNKESGIEKKMKPPRLCSVCNERTHHDARNCPKKK